MKSKHLLLMLLMAFFAPWAANAQETVEIGTDGGTTTNSYLPAYTLYNNTLSEQIYTAEEVTMAGTISSISFYNGGSTKSPEIKLYLVNTDKSEFTSTTDWLTALSLTNTCNGTVALPAVSSQAPTTVRCITTMTMSTSMRLIPPVVIILTV